MDGTSQPDPASGSTTPISAQEQARLRRERRNAKIMAGGSARMNKITSMSGRPLAAEAFTIQPSAESPSATPPPASTSRAVPVTQSTATNDDPEEVDISQHFYTPSTTHRTPSRSQTPQLNQPNPTDIGAQMQQMLAALNPQSQEPNSTTSESKDPMLRMLNQMLGGGGLFGGGAGFPGGGASGAQAGPGGRADAQPDIPPGLAQIFSAFTGTGTAGQQQENVPSTDYIWRIVHAIFAIFLALYITLYTSFTGSHLSRYTSSSQEIDTLGPRLFYAFATAQLLLQSSRYILEKGRLPVKGGLISGLGQLLPEPWGGYVRVWSRYGVILSTVVADGMVLVFVMGVLAWWRGGAVA